MTNNAAPVDGWMLTFAGDQRVTSGWSADLTQSGKVVTARNQTFQPRHPDGRERRSAS